MACVVKEYFIVPDDWRTLKKFKNIMLHNLSMSSFILAIAKTMNSKWIELFTDIHSSNTTNIIITFYMGNSLSKWINKYTSKCICITWENSHLCGFWLKNKTIIIRTKTTCCHAAFSNTHTNELMHICWYYHTMYTIIITLHWLSLLYTSFSLNIMLLLLRFVGLDITQAQERLCKDIKKNHISSLLIDIDPPTLQTEGSMN